MNLFAGAGALGICYDDFNADNFDHSDLKFIHGGVISLTQTGKRLLRATLPSGHAHMGSEFKKSAAYNFNRSLGIGAQARPSPARATIFLWIRPTRMPTGCPFCG